MGQFLAPGEVLESLHAFKEITSALQTIEVSIVYRAETLNQGRSLQTKAIEVKLFGGRHTKYTHRACLVFWLMHHSSLLAPGLRSGEVASAVQDPSAPEKTWCSKDLIPAVLPAVPMQAPLVSHVHKGHLLHLSMLSPERSVS